jgi:hypothetical protein
MALARADAAAAGDGRTPEPPRADCSFPVLSHVCVPTGEPLLAGVNPQLREARIHSCVSIASAPRSQRIAADGGLRAYFFFGGAAFFPAPSAGWAVIFGVASVVPA